MIESEAAKFVNDKEVAEIASLLYAAEILLLSFSKNPDMARPNKLTERANELGFYIMSPYQLCGADFNFVRGGIDLVRAIAERSKIIAANTMPYAELIKLDTTPRPT